jgi:hypothetical protein
MTTSRILAIGPEIIAKTECDKCFLCLNNEHPSCSVITVMGYAMVRLACRSRRNCRHNRSYGSLQCCNCPVRHEIFIRYGR